MIELLLCEHLNFFGSVPPRTKKNIHRACIYYHNQF
jgi:hypothetical protein